MEELKLSDNTIGHIAKILQVALLTGTDIVDNLRTIRLASTGEGALSPHPDYLDRFEKSLEEMIKEDTITEMKQALQQTVDGGWVTPEQEAGFRENIENIHDKNYAQFTIPVPEVAESDDYDSEEAIEDEPKDPDDEFDAVNFDDDDDVDEW